MLLFWDGYTSEIAVESTDGHQVTLSMDIQAGEYTRIQLSGVQMPWDGGQALFDIFTSIRGNPQDELQKCCYPGYPLANPAVVFGVPYRLGMFEGIGKNMFQQFPAQYPIMYAFETRFNEKIKVVFDFILPLQIRRGNSQLMFIVKAPYGYEMVNGTFEFYDASSCDMSEETGLVMLGDGCGYQETQTVARYFYPDGRKAELLLPQTATLDVGAPYRVVMLGSTPNNITGQVNHWYYDPKGQRPMLNQASQWVIEFTTAEKLDDGRTAPFIGSLNQFNLLSQVNFTVSADKSPPDVVIEIEVVIIMIHGIAPTRIDVYAPLGFKFLTNCMAPGQPFVKEFFVSCRERWSLFGATYVTGAIMETVDSGIDPTKFPTSVRLLARTPPITPERNIWMIRGMWNNSGTDVAWGTDLNAFPVTPFAVSVMYAAISGAKVPMFLSVQIRFGMQWGGYLHVAAPRTYQILCPVQKILSGAMMPECISEDPLLHGCIGLPLPGTPEDPDMIGLPYCHPAHEILLWFPRATTTTLIPADAVPVGVTTTAEPVVDAPYAIDPGTTLSMSLDILVPEMTPRPRSDNIIRVRALDANKIAEDGKLNVEGGLIRGSPRVTNFKMWWTKALPDTPVTVAIEFDFNGTLDRGTETPGEELLVIEVVAPDRLKMALRKPSDCVQLAQGDDIVPITLWNWTTLIPRSLWFGIDPLVNVSGKFHYSFPVLTPPEDVGMPPNNLWEVKFCGDSPYCSTMILSVPIPGFAYGESPAFDLDLSALQRLAGLAHRRWSPSFSLHFVLFFVALRASCSPPPWPSFRSRPKRCDGT